MSKMKQMLQTLNKLPIRLNNHPDIDMPQIKPPRRIIQVFTGNGEKQILCTIMLESEVWKFTEDPSHVENLNKRFRVIDNKTGYQVKDMYIGNWVASQIRDRTYQHIIEVD